jgi:tRNA A-37 threonylcarbamoyl transferase component Bud32
MSIQADRILGFRTSRTVYLDGDTVIKVFDKEYSKAEVLCEAQKQACIEETGLNIPKLLEVTKLDGKWAIISEYIRGKTLQRLIDEHPEKSDEYLELFVDLQLRVHSVNATLKCKLTDELGCDISATGLSAMEKCELFALLEGMPRHDNLCHGDFSPSNIIISDSGEPYIVDWANSAIGSAAADVARSYLLMRNENRSLAEKYIEQYCEKSDTTLRYIRKWIPIIAASQLPKGQTWEEEPSLSDIDELI